MTNLNRKKHFKINGLNKLFYFNNLISQEISTSTEDNIDTKSSITYLFINSLPFFSHNKES